jgi:hypothetical protein
MRLIRSRRIEERLCHELHLRELDFKRQVPLPLLDKGFRPDCGIHEAQLLT